MKFTLPLPETTNHSYATNRGRWYKTGKAKAWEELAWYEIKKQNKLKLQFTDNVMVSMEFFLKRDRDVDGGIKPVLDILQKAGVYKNDSQVQVVSAEKLKTEKKEPYVIVEVNDI